MMTRSSPIFWRHRSADASLSSRAATSTATSRVPCPHRRRSRPDYKNENFTRNNKDRKPLANAWKFQTKQKISHFVYYSER